MSIYETLTQTDGAEVQIEATADTLKPVFAYADKLVDEFKLRVDSDGLRYDVVDPANVCSLGMDVPAEAFDSYDADEMVIGMDTSDAMGALRAGRKRHDDEITVSHADQRFSATVHRDYDGTEMDLNTNFGTIDPDSVRPIPELDNVPEDELRAEATVPRRLFDDAISASGEVSKQIRFRDQDGDLYFEAEGDYNDATMVVSDVVDGEGANALFSRDNLNDLLRALATVDADDVTLRMGEEYPIRVEWETEWNDATVTGYWFQAPRVQS